MKLFFLILCIAAFCSCGDTPSEKAYKQATALVDSLENKRLADSLGKDVVKQVYIDIANEQSKKSALGAPVKIISAKFIKKEYSNYKDVRLVWKNVSDKTIQGIKFSWTGVNAFGEQADVGGYGGIGGGFDDEILKPGKTNDGTWSILSRDGKTITKAWVVEIAFTDGTKWKQ